MRYILGIDGGGSKTTAVLTDRTGRVIGKGQGGPSNYQTTSLEEACSTLVAVITATCRDAQGHFGQGSIPLDETMLVMGLAGADRCQDKANIRSTLIAGLNREPGRLQQENDARIALAGATGNKPGIIVIAGTGSIAFGIDGANRQIRVGGWGPILGDEGSGYSIGKAALTAILREYDGRGQATSLTKKILGSLGITCPQELIPLVYQGPLKRPEIAQLAKIVLEEAVLDDKVSRNIIDNAAGELAEMISTILDQLEIDSPVIAATGGLLKPGNPVWDILNERLKQVRPPGHLVQPLLPPVLGAVLLGKITLGGAFPEEDFVGNLVKQYQVSNLSL